MSNHIQEGVLSAGQAALMLLAGCVFCLVLLTFMLLLPHLVQWVYEILMGERQDRVTLDPRWEFNSR